MFCCSKIYWNYVYIVKQDHVSKAELIPCLLRGISSKYISFKIYTNYCVCPVAHQYIPAIKNREELDETWNPAFPFGVFHTASGELMDISYTTKWLHNAPIPCILVVILAELSYIKTQILSQSLSNHNPHLSSKEKDFHCSSVGIRTAWDNYGMGCGRLP